MSKEIIDHAELAALMILRLAENASPGPWRIYQDEYKHGIAYEKQNPDLRRNIGVKDRTDKDVCTVWNVCNTCIEGHQYKNQDFIAAIRELAPLVAEAYLQTLKRKKDVGIDLQELCK